MVDVVTEKIKDKEYNETFKVKLFIFVKIKKEKRANKLAVITKK